MVMGWVAAKQKDVAKVIAKEVTMCWQILPMIRLRLIGCYVNLFGRLYLPKPAIGRKVLASYRMERAACFASADWSQWRRVFVSS